MILYSLTVCWLLAVVIAAEPPDDQERDTLQTHADVLADLLEIEYRHSNLLTEFKLEVLVGPSDARDPRGENLGQFAKNSEFHCRALIHDGRLRLERSKPDGSGRETHWWDGRRAVSNNSGDKIIAFAPHIRELLTTCGSTFNESAGPALLSKPGLPAGIAAMQLLGQEEDDGVVRYTFAPPHSETTRFEVVIDPQPAPRIIQWNSHRLNDESGEWEFNLGYRVKQWMEFEGRLLPAVAFKESTRIDKQTGIAERIIHRYTRTDVSIVDNDDVSRLLRLPVDEEKTVYDTLAEVQWQLGDRKLIVDHVYYSAAKPIWVDPVPLLADLLRTAQGGNAYGGNRKALAYLHVVDLGEEDRNFTTVAVVDSDPAAVPEEPQFALPDGLTAAFAGWTRVTPGDDKAGHVRWQGDVTFAGETERPLVWVEVRIDGVERPLRVLVRE